MTPSIAYCYHNESNTGILKDHHSIQKYNYPSNHYQQLLYVEKDSSENAAHFPVIEANNEVAPVISVSGLAENYLINNRTVQINFNFEIQGYTLVIFYITNTTNLSNQAQEIDATVIRNASKNISLTVNDIDEGNYKITITALDVNHLSTTEEHTLTFINSQ